jgi:hypothetical protein
MGACAGYTTISRDYILDTNHELRHRTGFNADLTGVHGDRHSEAFNSTFFTACGEVVRQLEIRAGKTVDWIGDIGVGVCKDDSYHASGRAFDLSQIRFTDGTLIDCNAYWQGTLAQQRQYVGLVAQCRLVVGTVLNAWYLPDTTHRNHVHFDNGTAFVPIRESKDSDTSIVQAACNYLNGESLKLDDDWGSLTQAAYNRLLTTLKVQCLNPKSKAADATLFLGLIAQTGLAGAPAGTYLGPC